MKFYRDKKLFAYWSKIINNRLSAIHINQNKSVRFLKNGSYHNLKNASFIRYDKYNAFCLNGKAYGYNTDFTKESWRRFVKLRAFL
jgi:hypothetical protein